MVELEASDDPADPRGCLELLPERLRREGDEAAGGGSDEGRGPEQRLDQCAVAALVRLIQLALGPPEAGVDVERRARLGREVQVRVEAPKVIGRLDPVVVIERGTDAILR